MMMATTAAFVYMPAVIVRRQQRFVFAAFDQIHQFGQILNAFHPIARLAVGQVRRQHGSSGRIRLPRNPITVLGALKLRVLPDGIFCMRVHALGDFELVGKGVHMVNILLSIKLKL